MIEAIPEMILAGVIGFIISSLLTWTINNSFWKRKINSSIEEYHNKIGELIDKAVVDGPDKAIDNGIVIVKARDLLRDELLTLGSALNKEIDELSELLSINYYVATTSEKQKIICDKEHVYKLILNLQKTWPLRKGIIMSSIKKILVELDIYPK